MEGGGAGHSLNMLLCQSQKRRTGDDIVTRMCEIGGDGLLAGGENDGYGMTIRGQQP